VVYIVFIVMMGIGAIAAFLLLPPNKIIRDDGSVVATIQPRTFGQELKANLEIFRDWKLLAMVSRAYVCDCAALTQPGACILACGVLPGIWRLRECIP
jgi:hypothetical protein